MRRTEPQTTAGVILQQAQDRAFLIKSTVFQSCIFSQTIPDQAMKTKDDVLERIKKLMALSHSANPNEAAVALSQDRKSVV